MLRDGLDGVESTFPYCGIFLVCELFLQKLYRSIGLMLAADSYFKNTPTQILRPFKTVTALRRLEMGVNSLRGSIVFLDRPVDEGGNVTSSGVGLIGGLGD